MLWISLSIVLFLIALLHVVIPRKYNWPSVDWKISKIPGPLSLPYVGNAFLLAVPNEEFLGNLISIVDKYGSIFRIYFLGIPLVFLTDVDDVEIILNSRQHITKSDDYLMLTPWLGTGLLTSTGKKWFDHRKWLTPAFHFGILEQYLDVFVKNANILIEQIEVHAKNEHVEINPLVTLCTLDIICETAMGTQVHAQTGGEKEYVKATLRMSSLFQIRQISPWMYREWMFALCPTGMEQKKVLKTLHGLSERVIRERKVAYREEQKLKQKGYDVGTSVIGAKKKMSFLDLLIEISEKENKMTEEEIREEVDTFMFEGHDTTSAAICWALFEIGSHPEVQENVIKELQEIYQDSDRAPTYADLQEMKYLERVIKETLRLYPSVPIISRQLEVDVKIRDYIIPAGTNTPLFIYYIHRNPKLYPNPEKFDPDRFLPEVFQGRHPYSYIPFSAGPRNCIGQRFALMEEKVVLSQIIRKFHITSLDKRENIKLMAELILRPKDNLKIIFKKRS